MSMKAQPLVSGSGPRSWPWLWLSLFMLAIAVYFVGRYGGMWAETDSASFARYIRGVVAEGTLNPEGSDAYPNGYSFQAISAFIIGLTGLEVATLQQLVYPLFTVLIVIPAWMMYRELTGDARGASLATMLLLTQPEFLFVMLRSSHEKFLRLMLVLCLFLLVRSFRVYRHPVSLAVHVLLFYIAAFAMIAHNNFLANSFFVAVAVALGLGWLLQHCKLLTFTGSQDVPRRFLYVVAVCLGLVHLFIFYIYPPARHDLLVLWDIWERVAALFLDVESKATNAYQQVAAGWISLPIFFILSIANWTLLVASVAIWAGQSWRWLRHRVEPPTMPARILWLLYTAFAIQGAISIAVDASGTIAANFQHRLFPSFSMVAVAMVGTALARWQPRRSAGLAHAALVVGLGAIAVLSALKASSEPLFSNKWIFYRQEELTAIDWADAHLRNSAIWTEIDERLQAAYRTTAGQSLNNNGISAFNLLSSIRMLLASDVSRLHSNRLNNPLPIPYDALRIYDNGAAELYRLRPVTPFQK